MEAAARLGPVTAFERIVRPRSVALVGASGRAGTMPSIPLRNLIKYGYGGTVHLVNPGHSEVDGRPCYADVGSLPEVPDTAIILLRASGVLGALRACADAGIPTATIVASGLTEGVAAVDCEANAAELRRILTETKIRVMGPNTAGLVNVVDSYVPRASINLIESLVPGNMAIVSQSGALGTTVLNQAMLHGVGVTYAIGTGNQLDLDLWDAVEFLLHDNRTGLIVVIVEGFKDPSKFLRVADLAVQASKPLILLKVGRSSAGGLAVGTHSGALAGEHRVQRAVLAERGVVEVSEIDQLWRVAELFQRWGVRPGRIRRLGVIAFSGGEAAIAADTAENLGFEMPQPAPDLRARLAPMFTYAEVRNPFDLTGQWVDEPHLIGDALSAIEREGQVDAIVIPMSVTPTSRAVRELIRWASDDWGGTLPIAVGMRSNASDMRGVSKPLTDKGLAVLDGPEELFRALSLYAAYTDRRDAASGRMSKRVLAKGGTMTVTAGTPRESTYWGARRALSGLRLPFNPAVLVASADEATEAARRIGFPVTMKISKLDVPHKAMAGAVVDLVTTSDEVQNTARRFLASWGGGLPDGDTEGLVIERYAASRLAVFVGAQRDLEFGPMALFGLGGSYAERYADIRFIPLPTTHAEIEEAIAATNMGALICGIGAAALKDCVEVVSTIGEWFCNTPSARSVDLNPLLVGGAGEISIVDARISWQEQGR